MSFKIDENWVKKELFRQLEAELKFVLGQLDFIIHHERMPNSLAASLLVTTYQRVHNSLGREGKRLVQIGDDLEAEK